MMLYPIPKYSTPATATRDRRGVDVAGHGQIERPLQAQLLDVGIVDLLQRAVVVRAEGAPVHRPVGAIGFIRENTVRVAVLGSTANSCAERDQDRANDLQ